MAWVVYGLRIWHRIRSQNTWKGLIPHRCVPWLSLQLLPALSDSSDGAVVSCLLGHPTTLVPGVAFSRHVGALAKFVTQILSVSQVSIYRISGTLTVPLLHCRRIDISLQILLLVESGIVRRSLATRGVVLLAIAIPHRVARWPWLGCIASFHRS